MYRLIAKLTRRIVLAIPYPHTTSSNRASVMKHIPRVLAISTVLFVNGIPVATLELKSQFKQSVENAKRQYRYDRPVKDPLTRKPEPLLAFKPELGGSTLCRTRSAAV